MAVVLERLLWSRLRAPEGEVIVRVGNGRARIGADDVIALAGRGARADPHATRRARMRFRDALAEQLAARAGRPTVRGAPLSNEDIVSAVRKTSEYQKLTNRAWPRVAPDRLFGELFKNRRRLTRDRRATCSATTRSRCCVAVDPPAGRLEMTPTDVALLRRGALAHRPRDAHVRPRRHRRGAEPHADGAADGRPARAAAVADDPRRHRAAHDRGAGCRAGRTCSREAGVERVRRPRARAQLPRARRLPAARGAASPTRARACRAACARAPWPPVAVETEDVGLGAAVAALAARMSGDVRQRRRRRAAGRARRGPARRSAARSSTPTPTRDALGPGVNLLDLHVVKGLEFDAVVVVEPATILDERPDGGRGGLYTALTPLDARARDRPRRAAARGARHRPGPRGHRSGRASRTLGGARRRAEDSVAA